MREIVTIAGVIAVLVLNVITFTYLHNVKQLDAVKEAYTACLVNQKQISDSWLSSGKNNIVSIPSCGWGR